RRRTDRHHRGGRRWRNGEHTGARLLRRTLLARFPAGSGEQDVVVGIVRDGLAADAAQEVVDGRRLVRHGLGPNPYKEWTSGSPTPCRGLVPHDPIQNAGYWRRQWGFGCA